MSRRPRRYEPGLRVSLPRRATRFSSSTTSFRVTAKRGLSLAAELALGERVVLVTSRYEGAGGAGGLSEAQGAASAQGTGRVGADACGGGGGGDFREGAARRGTDRRRRFDKNAMGERCFRPRQAPSDVLHGREF